MATIPIEDVLNRQLLPIDAQDVVTKVRLVVAGNHAGAEPTTLTAYATDDSLTIDTVTYMANPIVHVHEAPEHAIYGCERSFALPEGVDPFLPPQDPGVPEPWSVVGFVNPGSPSAIRDGDPSTSAILLGEDGGDITYLDVEDAVGARLRYSRVGGEHAPFSVTLRPGPVGVSMPYGKVGAGSVELPETTELSELYRVLPPDARWALENGAVQGPHTILGRASVGFFRGTASGVAAAVNTFYPLVLNRPLLESIAAAQVRLPAQNPQRVTVRGYVAPDRTHTIVGWPGGDYTGRVAQVQYELGRTVIDFEQAGAPLGLPAEALEAARERRVAIDRAVQDAAYPVRMGERL